MRRRVSVREARRILTQQEANRLVDFDAVVDEAIQRVEDAGVVFLDEIDKTIPSNRIRSGRLGRRRAARSAADRRGLGGDDPLRPGADRSRPLHRRRRIPSMPSRRI